MTKLSTLWRPRSGTSGLTASRSAATPRDQVAERDQPNRQRRADPEEIGKPRLWDAARELADGAQDRAGKARSHVGFSSASRSRRTDRPAREVEVRPIGAVVRQNTSPLFASKPCSDSARSTSARWSRSCRSDGPAPRSGPWSQPPGEEHRPFSLSLAARRLMSVPLGLATECHGVDLHRGVTGLETGGERHSAAA